MTDEKQPEKPPARSRRRRNVIGGSMHRNEYVRLMEAGWSSASLERYAAWRHGEDIPASTFRDYKRRQKLDVHDSRLLNGKFDTDALPDVLTKRVELITLQTQRLAIDAQHERDMRKLFGTTRGEIALLNTLLNEMRADLVNVGMLGENRADPTPQVDLPKHQTLGEVLDGDETQLAEVLHLLLPREA